MALWAFHNNPGIGGFGESNPILFGGSKIRAEKKRNAAKEKKRSGQRGSNRSSGSLRGSSDRRNIVNSANKEYCVGQGDLICQIVKELVDNAVDACRSSASECNAMQQEHQKRRIRVDIRSFHDTEGLEEESKSAKKSRGEILQLTVTDTGCGMENIQNCVNAFQTSKGGKHHGNGSSNNSSSAEVSSGRYGIGLTLCLLHAQRCVPNSRACISSATSQSKHLTRAFFEVDKEEDCVKCVQQEEVNFTTMPTESGTCVSLLIPVSYSVEYDFRVLLPCAHYFILL